MNAMYDPPIKFTLTVAGAIASGTASVISEQTLVPLGLFLVFAGALLGSAWRISSQLSRLSTQMENQFTEQGRIRERINNIEARERERIERHNRDKRDIH